MTTQVLDSSEREHMCQLASKVLKKAYAPYSKFLVGTCLKSISGNYYTGCNIENASYSLVLCAEACAIAHMVAAGEQLIQAAVIVSSGDGFCFPCGACRQMFKEFSGADILVYMYNPQQQYLLKKLSELLPHSFGPTHMGIETVNL